MENGIKYLIFSELLMFFNENYVKYENNSEESHLPRPFLAPKLGRVFSEPHPFLCRPLAL